MRVAGASAIRSHLAQEEEDDEQHSITANSGYEPDADPQEQLMRNLNLLNQYRRTDEHVLENWGWTGDYTCGMFMVPSPVDGKAIAVITPKDDVAIENVTNFSQYPFARSFGFAFSMSSQRSHLQIWM